MQRKGDEPVPGFKLVARLGRGSFGEVWKATGPGGTWAALKFIGLFRSAGMKEFRALLRVKQVRHVHLTPIIGMWLADENGRVLDDACWEPLASQGEGGATLPAKFASLAPTELIVAMPLGEKDLAARLAECRAAGERGIPLPELLGYMRDAAEGLDYLNAPRHDLGEGPVAMQHGDVKPQNLLIVGGSVQVCDFGLARALSANGSTTGIGGSPAYIAPECLRDRKPSATADQYSLAITYVELRTGMLPFDDISHFGILDAHAHGKLNLSGLPEAERAIVARASAMNPQARYASCGEFVQALCKLEEARRRQIESSDTQPLPLESAAPSLPASAAVPITPPGAEGPAAIAQAGSPVAAGVPTGGLPMVKEAKGEDTHLPRTAAAGVADPTPLRQRPSDSEHGANPGPEPATPRPPLEKTMIGGVTLPSAPPGHLANAAQPQISGDVDSRLHATQREGPSDPTHTGHPLAADDVERGSRPRAQPGQMIEASSSAGTLAQQASAGENALVPAEAPCGEPSGVGLPRGEASDGQTAALDVAEYPPFSAAYAGDALAPQSAGQDDPPRLGVGRFRWRPAAGAAAVLGLIATSIIWWMNRPSPESSHANRQLQATAGSSQGMPSGTGQQVVSHSSANKPRKAGARPHRAARPRLPEGPKLPQTNDPAELMAVGKAWLALGDVLGAEAACSRALELDRAGAHVAELHELRGRARLQQGLFKKARDDFDAALGANMSFQRARLGRAWARAGQHEYEQALAEFTILRGLDPHSPEEFALRASAARGTTLCGGEVLWAAALEDYSRALAAQPTEPLWLVERAECHRQLGRLDAANNDLHAALALAPQLAEAHHGRGLLHRERANYRQAVASLVTALELRPQHAAWRAELAEVYYLKGDSEAALAGASQALQADRLQPLAFLVRGLVHRDRNDYTEALLDLNAALRWRGFEAKWLVERATVFYQKQEYSLALADVQRALQLDAALAPAANLRGLVLQAQGDQVAALAAFSEAIRLGPSQAVYYVNRADVYRTLGQIDQALFDLNVALGLDAEYATAYNLRGLCYFSWRDFTSAASDFTQALRRRPTSAAYYHNRGDANYRLGNLAEALADFTRSLERSDSEPYTLFLRGSVYLERGEYPLAVADFSKAIQLRADQPDYYASRADAFLRQGDYDKALADAERAIELDARSALGLRIRAAVHEARQHTAQAAKDFAAAGEEYTNQGDYERGKTAFSDAIRIEPHNALHYAGRANCLYKLRAYTDALTDATRAIELDPKCERAWNMRANTYDALGDFERAIADYTEAIRLAPGKAVYLSNRGDAYLSHRDYQLAIADFTKAIELEPNEPSHYANRATCYYWLDEIQLGLNDIEQALRLDPTLARAHNMRGNLLDARGDYEAALEAYSEAIRGDPTTAVYRYNRGKTFSNHNEYDAAIADFTDAILLAPQVALYRSYRANCYYWKNELAQAEADAQAAIDLDNACHHAYNVRGRVRYHRGQFAEAVADFTRAIELVPTDPTYRLNRAKAYEQLGNADAAKADLDEAERLKAATAPQTPSSQQPGTADPAPRSTADPSPQG